MSEKHYYTARQREDNQIGVRMPGTEYVLSLTEARNLRNALTQALQPTLVPPTTRCPMWVLELRSLSRAQAPLFGGLLAAAEDGNPKWMQDKELAEFLAREWVAIVEGGFVITERGRAVYEKEWAAYQTALKERGNAGTAD